MSKDRLSKIGKYIIDKGQVSTEELAYKFDISIVTVRRDLKKLEEDNVITKIYGGARAKSDRLKTYQQRENLNRISKEHIASIARTYINDGDRIFIDSGTTVENILDGLDDDINLSLFTNNLAIIKKAVLMENVNLFIVGNYYNSTSNSFTYWGKVPSLNEFNIDKAFMCTSGLTIIDGLTNKNPLEQEIKRMICSLANNIYLLVDDSKIGKSSLMSYAKLEDIDVVITNKFLNNEYVNFLSEHNIELRY